MNQSEKIARLREWMREQQLDAFYLPIADAFLSEYVPSHEARLTWLTGFTGSAGATIITRDAAYLFTDGRYTLQAKQQLDTNIFEIINIADRSPAEWLKAHANLKVAYDSKLHPAKEIDGLKKTGVQLHALAANPIDAWWKDRPVAPTEAAWIYPENVAGASAQEKIQRITEALEQQGADALFVAAPEQANWLLNIRGHDVECTPVLQCFALLQKQGNVTLFANDKKLPIEVLRSFSNVSVQPLASVASEFKQFQHQRVWMDLSQTTSYVAESARAVGVNIIDKADPVELAKAVKNPVELQGIRNAHREDGAALAEVFASLHQAFLAGDSLDELQMDAMLNAARAKRNHFICLSFPAIVGAGEHGAIIHYHVTPETNRKTAQGELLLIDSGGQYLGGTTDVTRTLAVGEPKAEYIEHYTRVLKGHIALARAMFPHGANGSQLDALARQYLWEIGLDYEHGTGHGVGACLGVHEGPQRISKRPSNVPLMVGMVISNEPGVYISGSHGIRIENLVEVVEKNVGGRSMLGFENLTLVPYARELMHTKLLNEAEIDWINAYHAHVYQEIVPLVGGEAKAWLKQACQPIKRTY